MRRTTTTVALAALLLALTAAPAAAEPAEPTTTTSLAAPAGTTSSTSPTTTTTEPSTTTTSVETTKTTHAPFARARATPAATVTVETSGPGCSTFCFSPAQTTIAAGGTVTFTNLSGADHTVKRCTPAACNGASGGTGDDPAFSSMTLALPAGANAEYTFSRPGTYVYYCTLHGYALMHGTITVTAAPPATTVGPPPTTPSTGSPSGVTPPTTDPDALASTGGSLDPLIAVAVVLLVVGGAALGLSRRRETEKER